MTISNDEIGQRLLTYMGAQNNLLDETRNWLSGTVNGGPYGDGRYPLTRANGLTVYIDCPAKQLANASVPGGFDFSTVRWVSENQINQNEVKILIRPSDTDTAPALAQPFMFASRRTQDLEPLPDSEFAEQLQVLSNTGASRRLPVGALLRAVGNVIDPTHPPYNVVYDFQRVKPVTIENGSNRISTTESVFKATDVGKLMAVSNGDNRVGALVGYIGQVIDSRNIRLFTDRTFSTPANANNNQSYTEAMWGTDCTAGMQRALDDAEPASVYTRGRVVVLGGVAMVTQLRFGSIAIVGLGTTICGFAALPLANSTQPFIADKITDKYATLRADSYALINITIFGMRYCQYYSTFRRNLDIRGGSFGNFVRGAPYALIDGLDSLEAVWDGIATSGAFAGRFSNVRAFQNAQCGMRMGFWDLNGQNWHAEGNGGPGILSTMPGCNVATVRSSYNGVDGGTIYLAGKVSPHEMGSNITECGFGNTWSNVRMQESWAHSLCISGFDPLGVSNGGGNKNAFFLGTFDDTGNISGGKGGKITNLPGVRAMVYCRGNTASNNTIDQVTGAGQVMTKNYATNAYWDEGNPSGNDISIRTPGIGNNIDSWFSGDGPLAATARGPWGTSSTSSIEARGNYVEINRQVAGGGPATPTTPTTPSVPATPVTNSALTQDGDSITEGPNYLAGALPPRSQIVTAMTGRPVANYGVSGRKLSEMAETVDSRISSPSGSQLIVLGGVNDILNGGANFAALQASLRTYASKTAGKYRLYVGSILPFVGGTAEQQQARSSYNNWIKSDFGTMGIAGIVDYAGLNSATYASDRRFYLDGLHPTLMLQAEMAHLDAKTFGAPVNQWNPNPSMTTGIGGYIGYSYTSSYAIQSDAAALSATSSALRLTNKDSNHLYPEAQIALNNLVVNQQYTVTLRVVSLNVSYGSAGARARNIGLIGTSFDVGPAWSAVQSTPGSFSFTFTASATNQAVTVQLFSGSVNDYVEVDDIIVTAS